MRSGLIDTLDDRVHWFKPQPTWSGFSGFFSSTDRVHGLEITLIMDLRQSKINES